MIRRSFPFLLPLATLLGVAIVFSAAPVMAQTKPRAEVPAEEKSQARAIVRQLLKDGKIIRASEVKRGMRGVGRSVFQGTAIEEFPIEVLGVLERVQGGGDIVLIKVLGGTVVKRQSGIIAGMSGSPVYINGKMLGAIAMGWGFPKEPIGGVTPITEMIETSLPDPSRRKIVAPAGKTAPPRAASLEYRPKTALRVAGHAIRRVVMSRDRQRVALAGPTEAATMTLRPATTLLQLSGYSARSLPRLRKLYEPYGIEPVIGALPSQIIGISSKKTGVMPPFKPGGALGVQLVSGDMDQTAVGTITFRWGNRILAFGHPMFGQGPASLPIASAYVHEIFPSYMRSFKLASPVNVVGALQQDTQFAIGGTLGMTADTIPMKVALRDSARQIARTYRVKVMKDPVLTPQLISVVAAEAMETTLGLTSDKMVRVGMRMEIDGAEPIVRHNLLYANGVVIGAGMLDLGQSLAITQMNEFERGSIRSVELDVAVEPVRRTARIKQVVANRNKVKPGETVQVSVLLEPTDKPGTTITHTFDFTVPTSAPSGELRIAAGASADFWPLQVRVGGPPPQPTNLKELVTAWGQVGAVNQLMVVASTDQAFLKVDRQKVPNPPPSWSRLVRTARSTGIGAYNEIETRRATTDFALFGAQFLTVPIEDARQRDKKTPATPVPTPKPGSSETSPTIDTAPVPDLAGAEGPDTGASAGAWSSATWSSKAFDRDRLLETSFFLEQIKVLQHVASRARQGGEALQQAPAPTLPGREQPVAPITPSAPVTPTLTPTPKATPAPTPTPIPESKTLGRPALSWVQQGVSDFLTGELERVLVTNDGQIRPAPPVKLLATTAQPFVWSIAADAGGNTYLGSGNKARIIRVAPNGTQSTFYDGTEIMVSALTTDKAGNVYAGVSPGGIVYRLSPDGKRTTIFDTEQTFIWALAWDEAGRLLIGTGGTEGKLYRLLNPATPSLGTDQPAGRSPVTAAVAELSLLAKVTQKHIRSLSVRGNDIFAGSGEQGVLYRIDGASGAATALFQAEGRRADDSEVLAVAAAPEGVYFGLSNSGTIYRWHEKTGVITIYPSPQQAIYALQRAADGKLYAATGDKGVVYQLQPGANENDTFVARILEPAQLQALALALTPSGNVLIGTGNNGAAFQMAAGDTASGSFVSSVFDAKNVAQWGALRVIGRGVGVEVRSGNTVEPDTSWSAWKPVQANDLGEMQITAPAARFLQYRARFSSSSSPAGVWTVANNPEPGLSRVEVVYRTKNSPPSVGLSAPLGGDYWRAKKRITWSGKDPDSDPLRYRLWLSSDDGKTWKPIEMEDTDSSSFELDTTKWTDGTYRIKVESSDALRNPEDPLRDESISLPFIIDNTAPRIASLDVIRLTGESGGSGLRLQGTVADDRSPITGAEWRLIELKAAESNVATEAKPALATTGNKSTPTVSGESAKPVEKAGEKSTDKAEAKPTGSAATSGSPLKKPSAKDQDDEWHAVAAEDGIFDSRRETLAALITLPPATAVAGASTPGGSAPGGRRIEVRVHDAAGNTKTADIAVP